MTRVPRADAAVREATVADRMRVAAEREGIVLAPSQQRALVAVAALATAPAAHDLATPRGMYLHGPVGSGKTWLVDRFVEALAPHDVTRVHARPYLTELGAEIFRRASAGDGEAAASAVDEVLRGARFAIIDELEAHDAGDARLLALTFRRLAERGVALVVTSNHRADELMADSPWRHTMLDAIAALKRDTAEFLVDDGVDHRLGAAASVDGFRSGQWIQHQPSDDRPTVTVESGGRRFDAFHVGEHFEISFAQLCEAPTASVDYIDWIDRFARWRIVDVPPLPAASPGARQRFLTLIDMLVDADVCTDIVSTVSLTEFAATAIAPIAGRQGHARLVSRLRLLDET